MSIIVNFRKFICSFKVTSLLKKGQQMPRSRPSSDAAAFREVFKTKKNIVVLTGAGTSAESGIPTFRGEGGFWRKYQAQHLATMEAFKKNPSLVWEFYHYRRELVLTKQPNKAHYTIAKCQKAVQENGGNLTIVTQNIDGLHQAAGAKEVIELHGSLFKTRCMQCKEVKLNRVSPICPSLAGKGKPDPDLESNIPAEDLPRCENSNCKGLLRPHVVWFGEALDPNVLDAAERVFDTCDMCLVIGTSSVVYPAAMFAPQVAQRGVPVAEFNIEETPATFEFQFHFQGPSATTLPNVLGIN